MSKDLLTQIYNSFDPFQPLPAGDPAYVDCAEVRGDANVLVDLGNKILRADRMVCQLYAGHRGGGKSTELLRLKAHLEQKGCLVVYFAADEGDIDPEDAQYTDILLSCTRHLLEELKDADPTPILGWLGDRWNDLKDLALTEISFEKLDVEAQITQFAKLTASIRAIPSERQKIRDRINPHTITLLKALNDFIEDAKRKLPKGKSQLVVIADNLDRIVPIPQDNGRTNHDEIFLDRSQQLQGLNCHVIYTIPISMIYSSRAADLRDIYGDPQVLPMVMVQTPDGKKDVAGIAKLIEIITKRINRPDADLVSDLFGSAEGLQRLCLMSGGHVRSLILLVRSAIDYIDVLPITDKAIQRCITQARDTYRRTVESGEWITLAKVSLSKSVQNSYPYKKLLYSRCILQYRHFDDNREIYDWYDVHPLIRNISNFRDALEALSLPDNSFGEIDDIALAGMNNVYKLYEEALKIEDYDRVVSIATYASIMLEEIAESLDPNKDRDVYRRIIALASYWNLNKNLYASRIKS